MSAMILILISILILKTGDYSWGVSDLRFAIGACSATEERPYRATAERKRKSCASSVRSVSCAFDPAVVEAWPSALSSSASAMTADWEGYMGTKEGFNIAMVIRSLQVM